MRTVSGARMMLLSSLLMLLALCFVFVPSMGSDEADGSTTTFIVNGIEYTWNDDYSPRTVNVTGIQDDYELGETLVIPDSIDQSLFEYRVVGIDTAAFLNKTGLKEVTLGKYVKSIGDYAFAYSGLETIKLGYSINQIGEGAFSNTNLQEIVLTQPILKIQFDSAFIVSSKSEWSFVSGYDDAVLEGVYTSSGFEQSTLVNSEAFEVQFNGEGFSAYFKYNYRYNVEHYLMDEDGLGYTLDLESTQILYGRDTTEASFKDFEGYDNVPFEQMKIFAPTNYSMYMEYRFTPITVKIYYDLDLRSVDIPEEFVQEYGAGDSFTPFDTEITYRNGVKGSLQVTEDMVQGFSTLKSGEFKATVKFRGETATFTYIVSPVTYDLWIGGVQITNDENVIEDDDGGTASFDITTNTLTLDDFDVDSEETGIRSTMVEQLDIIVKGVNNIISAQNGIDAVTLSIVGDGTLNIDSGGVGIKIGKPNHTDIRGMSGSERLQLNIYSGGNGIYRVFVAGDSNERSESTTFQYCEMVLAGSGNYGIHGGKGTYIEDCTVDVEGYGTGIFSGGAALRYFGIENSTVSIRCTSGLSGYNADPVFENSRVDIISKIGINVRIGSIGDITLQDSDLSIRYLTEGIPTSPQDFIVNGDSSIIIAFDHENGMIDNNVELFGGIVDIIVKDPEGGIYDYVVLAGGESGSLTTYTRDNFYEVANSTETQLRMPKFIQNEEQYHYEFHPMLTVSFDGDGREGSMDSIPTYEGGIVELPQESGFTPGMEGTFIGWEETYDKFYLPGRTIVVTQDIVLSPVYGELVPRSISVSGEAAFVIGDRLEGSDLMVTIEYEGGKSTVLHITDALFTVSGFGTEAYVPDDQPGTATVKYNGLSCTFDYTVAKLLQSTDFTLVRISLDEPCGTLQVDEYFNHGGVGNRYYFGSTQGELTIELLEKGDAEFDYDEQSMTISNVSKPGTMTVLVTRAADDIYQEVSKEFQWTIQKFRFYDEATLRNFLELDTTEPISNREVTISLIHSEDAIVTMEVVEGGSATATIEDGVVSVTDLGTDGTVKVKVTVSGSPYYSDSSATFTLKFSKLSGSLEGGFIIPNGLTASKGQTTNDITLPENWEWNEVVTFETSGDIQVSATYTPHDEDNYDVYITMLTISVGKSASTVTLSQMEFTYADGLEIDFNGLVGGDGDGNISYQIMNEDGVQFEFSDGIVRNISIAGGSFDIVISRASTDQYGPVVQKFTIGLNKGVQEITVTGDVDSSPFDTPYEVIVTGNHGALAYVVSSGNATFTGNVLNATGAGTVVYTVNAAETDLYESDVEECSVTFAKIGLTVSVNDASIEYGSVPEFTVTSQGLVEGDILGDILGDITFTCGYEQYDDVGTYTVNVSGNAVHDDYDITYEPGELTVVAKSISASISSATSAYGAELAQLVATTEGIVNGDTDVYTLSTTATTSSGVGSYDIIGTINDTNYAVEFLNGNGAYTITKALIEPPVVESKIYTGEKLVADIPTSEVYDVVSNDGGIVKGEYDVVLCLKDAVNYGWKEHGDVNITLKFSILAGYNQWIQGPSINPWSYGDRPNELQFEAMHGDGTAIVEHRVTGTDEWRDGLPTDAGHYDVRVTIPETLDYAALSSTVQLTVERADPDSEISSTLVATYGQTLTEVMLPSDEGGVWTWILPGDTSVGDVGTRTFPALFTPKDLVNYNLKDDYQVTVQVQKADSIINTEPQASTGLIYDGTSQVLVQAGSSEGGVMQYRLGAGNGWSAMVPSATGAGTYTVYYKVVGDSNHNDTEEKDLTVSISKKLVVVTANDVEVEQFGSIPYEIGYTVSGLVDGDVIDDAPVVSLESDVDTDVCGTYIINVSGGSDPNYELQYVGGTLTISEHIVNQYTITFDSNGGSAVASITQDYGTPVTAPADPTKIGYTFVGWIGGVPEIVLEDITLTAQWSLDVPEVIVDNLSFTYDGEPRTIIPNIQHVLGDSLSYQCVWTDSEGVTVSETSEFEVKDVSDSGTYTLTVTSTVGEYESIVTVVSVVTIGKSVVGVPVIEGKPYTGEHQVADIDENNLYSVVSNVGGTDVGTYDVVLRLVESGNHMWSEGDIDQVTLKFQITRTPNSWVSVPTIQDWTYGDRSNLPVYEAKFGNDTAEVKYGPAGGTLVPNSPDQAGEYQLSVYIPSTTNYDAMTYVIEFKILRAVPDYTVPTANADYGDTLSTVELPEADNGSWSWQDPETTTVGDVGTRTFKATFTPNDVKNYTTVTGIDIDVEVSKVDPTVTIPTAESSLTYNGGVQPLVVAGNVVGGTMEYMLGEDGAWSSDIPAGTDAGQYTVYYRVIGDSNHNNLDQASIIVQIGKRNVTVIADDVSIVQYSEIPTVLRYTIDGLEEGYTLEVEPTVGVQGDIDTDVCGTYDITVSGGSDPNYELQYVGGTLTISEHTEHDFTGQWVSDETGHWHVCSIVGCDETDTKGEHEPCDATCESAAVCEVCQFECEPKDLENHVGGTEVRNNDEDFSGDTYCLGCNNILESGYYIYDVTFTGEGFTEVLRSTGEGGTVDGGFPPTDREGHTFMGWFTDGSDTPIVESDMFQEDTVLVGQWTVNQYTITFDFNEGSEVVSITQGYGTPVTAPGDPTRDGYRFGGWSPAVPSTMPAGDMTVTAQWERIQTPSSGGSGSGSGGGNTPTKYTVTFDPNGGSGAPSSISKTRNTTVNLPDGPSVAPEGYLFLGWGTSVGGDVEYYAGDSYRMTKDQRLYAIWGATIDPQIDDGDRLSVSHGVGETHLELDYEGYHIEADFDGEGLVRMTDEGILAIIDNADDRGDGHHDVRLASGHLDLVISGEHLEALAYAGLHLTIVDHDATVTYTPEVLDANLSPDSEVRISVDVLADDEATEAQMEDIGDSHAITLEIWIDGVRQHELGGTAYVSFAYQHGDHEDPDRLGVFHVTDDGEVTPRDSTYDADNGMMHFSTTTHSVFFVDEHPETGSDEGGFPWWIVGAVVTAVVAFLFIMMFRNRD